MVCSFNVRNNQFTAMPNTWWCVKCVFSDNPLVVNQSNLEFPIADVEKVSF